jgi:hypothetical protein
MQAGQLCFEQVYQGAGPSPVTVVIQVTAAPLHAKSMQRLQITPTRGCGNPGRPVHERHAAPGEFGFHHGDQLATAHIDRRTV